MHCTFADLGSNKKFLLLLNNDSLCFHICPTFQAFGRKVIVFSRDVGSEARVEGGDGRSGLWHRS